MMDLLNDLGTYFLSFINWVSNIVVTSYVGGLLCLWFGIRKIIIQSKINTKDVDLIKSS